MNNKYIETTTEEFLIFLTKSKRKLPEMESDGAGDFYVSFFQSFLKGKNIQSYSRFTSKGTPIAERVSGTVRNLLK